MCRFKFYSKKRDTLRLFKTNFLELTFVSPSVQNSQIEIHKYLNENIVDTFLLPYNATEFLDPGINISANNLDRYEICIINQASSFSKYILNKNMCPTIFTHEDIDDCQNHLDNHISLSEPFLQNNY